MLLTQGSATLAFNIRASVNVILALIRIHRVPRLAYIVFGDEYYIQQLNTQGSPSCRDTSCNFWLGYLEICSYAR